MTNNTEPFDSELDRLVDGELTTADQQRLLQRLEIHPQGWRRCALAFLEAQALRGEFQSMRADLLQPADLPATNSPLPMVDETSRRPWLTFLAMAASFLLALPLGPYLLKPSSSPVAPTANAPVGPATIDDARPSSPRPLGNLELVTSDGPVDVPFYDLQNGAHYLLDDQGALPESVIRSLEQAGSRVERSPSIMPVDLDNGSRVYLPIDNYRITPASNRAIQ